MALIRCAECNRDISDQAAACPGCGAPVHVGTETAHAPESPSLADGQFVATRTMMAELAKAAVIACNYRVDASDEAAGTVTFTTGMTMGSWTGVSGTVIYREVSPYHFEITGTAKQNVRGGQVVALDLFGEAKGKINNVIEQMKREVGKSADGTQRGIAPPQPGTATGCMLALICFPLVPLVLAIANTLHS